MMFLMWLNYRTQIKLVLFGLERRTKKVSLRSKTWSAFFSEVKLFLFFPCSQLSRALRGAHRPFLLISFFGVPEVHLGCGANAGHHPSSPLPAPSLAAPPRRSSVDPACQRLGPHLQSRFDASFWCHSFSQRDTTAILSSSSYSGGENPEGLPAAVALPESASPGRGPV